MLRYQRGDWRSADLLDGNPALHTLEVMRRTLEKMRKLDDFVIGFAVPWAERPLGFDLTRNKAMMS